MTAKPEPEKEVARSARSRTDASAWAPSVRSLNVGEVPAGALASTVQGRRLAGPLQGFGKMWQKTYRVRLADSPLSPAEVIAAWKEHFPSFWPKGNTFYAPLAGIRPGEVALFSVSPAGPVKLHSGVMVLYADDESFTFMTPGGHMLASWITFSAFRDADGTVVAQAQALERASDPLFELALTFGGHGANNRFWLDTLRNLAAHLGVDGTATADVVCVDGRRQWRYVGNVRYNAGFRSTLHALGWPIRRIRRG
jgi:hypothetical protein